MKKAKKLLALVLAVIMLFSVMSVGMSAVALTATVTDNSANDDDTYASTDELIICVPETIYMTPGDGESVKGQYYVNNTVDSSGVVTLAAEKEQGWGAISIYAPGATKFSFVANGIGGIGDPIIGTANTTATSSFEYGDNSGNVFDISSGHFSYTSLALYINGTGLTSGQTALIEWKVTLYFGADDTTGTTYYAYTTLYMPYRSVAAVCESRRTSNNYNEISSWITGVTGSGSRSSTLGADRVGGDGSTADGYLTYDPLWTSTFGVGSNKNPNDYVTTSDSVRTAHAVGVGDDAYARSIGYRGYLAVDSSRYTNTNQIPNFRIGTDILEVGSNPKDSTDEARVWYTLGNGNETIGTAEDAEPSGWTNVYDKERQGSTGRIVSINPNYDVSSIDGKYLHIASQVACQYISQLNYANAYVSVQFSVTDKSDLRAAVLQATSLDETKYTTASWRGVTSGIVEEFHEALRDAAAVLGNPGASQGSIDAALANLNAKKAALKVTLHFDAATNGGVFLDGESYKDYDVQFGANKTISLKSTFISSFAAARFGYEFIGFSLSPDDYKSASLTEVPNVSFGDTLYAHYKKTISVDFYQLQDIDGATEVVTNDLVLYNNEEKALDVNVEDAPVVADYKFAGWTTDSTSVKGESIGDTLENVTESINYYATYKKDVVVELDANGGKFDIADATGYIYYNYDLSQTTGAAAVTLPETAPTKEGHGFKGWNINGTLYQPGDIVELTESTVATAEWSINSYNVTFKYKNADGTEATVTINDVEYGSSVTAPEVPAYWYNQTMHFEFECWDVAYDSIAGDTVINAVYDNGGMHSDTFEGTHATCDKAGSGTYTCSICNRSYDYSSDALGHSWQLTDSKDATCTQDGYETYVCNRDSSHTKTDVLPRTGHSYEGTEYVAPTCTEDGYYISGTCENCGEDLAGVVIPKLGHDFTIEIEHKDATCSVDGNTIYKCSRCDETDTVVHPALGHDWTSVITAPKCEEDGKIVYTCSVCNESYETVLPATGHTWATIIIAPSCTAQGYTTVTCSDCGTTTRSDYVPALGHKYVDVVVAPTCSAQGYTKHTCSVCGYSYKSDFVEATGHDYSKTTVFEPTCTKRGYTLYECVNEGCTCTYKSDYVDALGHDYELIETVAAGITQNGYKLFECSRCHNQYKETIYSEGKALVCYTLYNDDGEVVAGATITVTHKESGETITITTDANGYFTYVFPQGTYTLAVKCYGYEDISGMLDVYSDENGVGEYQIVLSEMPCLSCSCACHADTFWGKIYRLLIKMFSIFGKIYCCDCCQVWQ